MEQRQLAEFRSLIEAVRAGTLFAHDKKAHDAWRRSIQSTSVAVSPQNLETAVMSLALTNPEYVAMGPRA